MVIIVRKVLTEKNLVQAFVVVKAMVPFVHKVLNRDCTTRKVCWLDAVFIAHVQKVRNFLSSCCSHIIDWKAETRDTLDAPKTNVIVLHKVSHQEN